MKYDELTNALRTFESHIKAGEVSDPLKYVLTKAADAIEELTDRNVGKWEILESFSSPLDDSHKDRCRCTNCGFIHVFTDYHFGQYNFCPQCGSKNGW